MEPLRAASALINSDRLTTIAGCDRINNVGEQRNRVATSLSSVLCSLHGVETVGDSSTTAVLLDSSSPQASPSPRRGGTRRVQSHDSLTRDATGLLRRERASSSASLGDGASNASPDDISTAGRQRGWPHQISVRQLPFSFECLLVDRAKDLLDTYIALHPNHPKHRSAGGEARRLIIGVDKPSSGEPTWKASHCTEMWRYASGQGDDIVRHNALSSAMRSLNIRVSECIEDAWRTVASLDDVVAAVLSTQGMAVQPTLRQLLGDEQFHFVGSQFPFERLLLSADGRDELNSELLASMTRPGASRSSSSMSPSKQRHQHHHHHHRHSTIGAIGKDRPNAPGDDQRSQERQLLAAVHRFANDASNSLPNPWLRFVQQRYEWEHERCRSERLCLQALGIEDDEETEPHTSASVASDAEVDAFVMEELRTITVGMEIMDRCKAAGMRYRGSAHRQATSQCISVPSSLVQCGRTLPQESSPREDNEGEAAHPITPESASLNSSVTQSSVTQSEGAQQRIKPTTDSSLCEFFVPTDLSSIAVVCPAFERMLLSQAAHGIRSPHHPLHRCVEGFIELERSTVLASLTRTTDNPQCVTDMNSSAAFGRRRTGEGENVILTDRMCFLSALSDMYVVHLLLSRTPLPFTCEFPIEVPKEATVSSVRSPQPNWIGLAAWVSSESKRCRRLATKTQRSEVPVINHSSQIGAKLSTLQKMSNLLSTVKDTAGLTSASFVGHGGPSSRNGSFASRLTASFGSKPPEQKSKPRAQLFSSSSDDDSEASSREASLDMDQSTNERFQVSSSFSPSWRDGGNLSTSDEADAVPMRMSVATFASRDFPFVVDQYIELRMFSEYLKGRGLVLADDASRDDEVRGKRTNSCAESMMLCGVADALSTFTVNWCRELLTFTDPPQSLQQNEERIRFDCRKAYRCFTQHLVSVFLLLERMADMKVRGSERSPIGKAFSGRSHCGEGDVGADDLLPMVVEVCAAMRRCDLFAAILEWLDSPIVQRSLASSMPFAHLWLFDIDSADEGWDLVGGHSNSSGEGKGMSSYALMTFYAAATAALTPTDLS